MSNRKAHKKLEARGAQEFVDRHRQHAKDIARNQAIIREILYGTPFERVEWKPETWELLDQETGETLGRFTQVDVDAQVDRILTDYGQS